MSLKAFVEEIFLKKNTIQDILDLYSNPSERGFKFERCADLLIKLGFLPLFTNDKYKHIVGNINEGKTHFLKDIKKYIETEKENSGNKTGISDITLYNEDEYKYIFISSKFYSKESSVKNYDIQNIKAMIDHNKHIYKNYEIFLLVNDKNDLTEKVLNSNQSSNYITKYMNIENIIDLQNLEEAFNTMKNHLHNGGDIFDNFIFNKKVLIHKFHQKLFEIKFFKQLKLNNKKFLLGLKPRSGKTFLTGFIISNDKKNYENFNILIITPAPNETSSQFLEMLENHTEFNEFNPINFNSGHMIDKLRFTNKNIIITSKQLLQNYINENGIISIKNLNFNYIFFDENHYGGITSLSKDIINTYKSENTILVFLTATFHKTVNHWNIPEDCSFYWDLEDEEMCKNENIKGLISKHGNEVNEALNFFNDSNILTSYEKMPNLELITTMFETSIFNNIKQDLQQSNTNKYGFSLKTLFSISKSSFKYEKEVELLLRYISGSKRHIDFPDEDKSIFGRIVEISTIKNSRTLLSNTHFTTQLWFLPFGIEQKINDVSKNLKRLMLNDLVLKEYEILILNSNIDMPIKDIKDEIKKQQSLGKENGKTGLIVLVGNQCSLGITLELCDITILLNDILSSDKIYQMMYRCMTEAPNKKCGFVVDLNINRVLNTIMDYSLYKKELNTENKIKYIVENNLINIDSDYFLNKKVNHEEIINNLLEIWKKDPINSLRKLLKNIEDEILEISNEDQKSLNNIFTKSLDKNNNEEILFGDNEDEPQELPSGKTITKEPNENSDSDSVSSEEETKKEDVKISLTKDVLPFVIPLMLFLTIKDNNKNFLEILNMVKHNKELLEIFNEQTFVWWNKSNIIDLIHYLIKKYIKDNSDIYNITIYIKMTIQSLLDKPIELLNFINDRLKPKDIEKKKFGEVFTPIPLIEEMLDKLPIEVWSDPTFKWLDPANGMGNFMISIYFRLMKGLKDIIPDDEQRKKHILENMLYMSEINKKNCFLTKQIFDINNNYKLNIYNGDSLTLDTLKVWNVEKFDIIVGNPPYQDDTGNKGNKLYPKFVELSINILLKDNGFLLFVHPSLWRQIEHKLGILMKSKQIIYLEIHNESDGQKMFSASTRYDWYLIQNKNYEYNTEIKDEDGLTYNINISKMKFIPNSNFNVILNLISSDIKVNVLHSESIYEPRKEWMNSIQTNDFKYPCIYSINRKNIPTFKYSSINNKGHFNIPKVIWAGGATGFILDLYGNYGMTQWASAITDDISNLELIKKALESNFFNKIIKSISVSKQEINYKILKEFNKNFYEYILNNEIECDNTSISSKSTTKSNKSTKSSTDEVILCGAPLKKKGETCKNKANPQCDGKCKRHFVVVV
jgi:hypothetical protein